MNGMVHIFIVDVFGCSWSVMRWTVHKSFVSHVMVHKLFGFHVTSVHGILSRNDGVGCVVGCMLMLWMYVSVVDVVSVLWGRLTLPSPHISCGVGSFQV
jgi:hypothetical protein